VWCADGAPQAHPAAAAAADDDEAAHLTRTPPLAHHAPTYKHTRAPATGLVVPGGQVNMMFTARGFGKEDGECVCEAVQQGPERRRLLLAVRL
jgi:hypothetical protein